MKKISLYRNYLIISLLVSLYIYSMLVSAWISDDILISLAQIVNFHHGDGLVVNFGERVQAFTHPTWFFLLSAITYITKDYYYTILVISMLFSLFSIFIIIYYAHKQKNIMASFLGLILLLSSKAFIDYTTSGLENPLSYLLFAGILYYLFQKKELSEKHLFLIYIFMALLFLNRMDYALILFPIVTLLLFRYRQDNTAPMIMAAIIVGAWFLFSLFYFGHFFPNTFYAKLEAGYPSIEFIQRGVQYFQVQYTKDPITLTIILFGVLIGLFKNGISRSLSIGLIFYLLYFLKSGGDFMQGRFFAIPAFVSTFLIVNYFTEVKIPKILYLFTGLIIFTGMNSTSPLIADAKYYNKKFQMGVADERGFYFKRYGLISPDRKWPMIVALGTTKPQFSKIICGGLGTAALSNRNKLWYIDSCALVDPLLSQQPAIQRNWRIGHQVRKIPTNYIYSVVNDNIHLSDRNLDKLYQDIKKVSRGELFDTERLKAIYRINFHNYNINKTLYKDPKIILSKADKNISNLNLKNMITYKDKGKK